MKKTTNPLVIDSNAEGIYDIKLKHYDSNGHNFGVCVQLENKEDVSAVYLTLPGKNNKKITALKTYKQGNGVTTIRAGFINDWLGEHFYRGQLFSAKLCITENKEHHYYDIVMLDEKVFL